MNKFTMIALQCMLFSAMHTILCMDPSQERTIVSLELDQIYYAYLPSFSEIKVNNRKLSDQDHHYIGAHVIFKELSCTCIIPALFLRGCKDGSKLHFHITDNKNYTAIDKWITAICHGSYGESFHQKLEKSLNKFFECPSLLGCGKDENLFHHKFLTRSPYGHGERGCPNKETFAKLATTLNMQSDDVIHINLD